MYLSRIRRGSLDPIEAAKSNIDVFCQFTVTDLSNGQIALQADTGMYLSRIRRGSLDPIEAAKSNIDVFCQFTLVTLN
jgi:F420-dependent methylenetetrahydromethanopterin dehydrogenase